MYLYLQEQVLYSRDVGTQCAICFFVYSGFINRTLYFQEAFNNKLPDYFQVIFYINKCMYKHRLFCAAHCGARVCAKRQGCFAWLLLYGVIVGCVFKYAYRTG